MPLIKSGSRAAVSRNIREMVAAGHPQKQAIAAALSNARRYGAKFAEGGRTNHDTIYQPKDREEFTVQDWSRYPNYSDLDQARQNDLSYGDPSAGFFKPGAKENVAHSLDIVEQANDPKLSTFRGRLDTVDAKRADQLERVWLAVRKSPTAYLGFDPRRMISSPATDPKLTAAGVYDPAAEKISARGEIPISIWSSREHPATAVHESMHRGMQLLKNAGKLPLPQAGANEDVVRALMVRHLGDIEMGRGNEADRQSMRGRQVVSPRYLDALEKAAAEYIAMQKPRGPHAAGGRVNPFAAGGSVGKYAVGGGTSWEERASGRALTHAGMIHSTVPGRTDALPITVGGGAFVIPADHLAALGQGNSLAGGQLVNRMLGLGKTGSLRTPRAIIHKQGRMKMPKIATGGAPSHDEKPVPIIAAGHEFVVPPDKVREIGGGDLDKGHLILERWVLETRKKHIKTLKSLKPPKR